jgi:hypothetical protein
VSVLFLNSWRVRVVPYYVTTHPPVIRKQYRHSGEAQIEPTLFECDCEQGRREGGGQGGAKYPGPRVLSGARKSR